jgi:hypothetical protein
MPRKRALTPSYLDGLPGVKIDHKKIGDLGDYRAPKKERTCTDG